jgi:hypothetical protein
MAILHIPLSLQPDGTLKRVAVGDLEIGQRLRLYLLWSMAEFQHSRSGGDARFASDVYAFGIEDASMQAHEDITGGPEEFLSDEQKSERRNRQMLSEFRTFGIRALWLQLYMMGGTARFHFILSDEQRRAMEEAILNSINIWLENIATIHQVELLGNVVDEHRIDDENGIRFHARTMTYTFWFVHGSAQRVGMSTPIGSWNMLEAFDARY